MKNLKGKDRIKIADADNPDHLEIDEILSGETAYIEIGDKNKTCPDCGSSHIRNRMIDLPILNDTIAVKKAKVLYCADCKTSIIEKDYVEELWNILKNFGINMTLGNLTNIINDAVIHFENSWKQMEGERKVISIYFPSKAKTPQKAQISLSVSDPLYSRIYNLTSKEVRKLLGLNYFEELKKQAESQGRTISQYLKYTLKEKFTPSQAQVNERVLLKVSEERSKYKSAKKTK